MIPRAVQMAKAVTDSELFPLEQGNILAPFCRGWTNNSVNYATFGTEAAPAYGFGGLYAGVPFQSQSSVYGFVGGQPFWRWFPVKPSSIFLGANTMFFGSIPEVRGIAPSGFSFTSTPPPLDALTQPA